MAIGPVAVLEPSTEEMRARTRELCEGFDLRFPASGAPEDFTEVVRDAEYVVTRGLRFPPEVLDRAEKLRLIHQWGTGVDGIPLDKARERGITVARSPGVNAPSVAEATVMLMLAALRHLPQVHNALRDGQWEMPDLWKQSRDLGACTVGLVGMGAIGTEVAHRLAAFGCDVIYTRTSGPLPGSDPRHKELDAVLARADVLSLHLPLTDRTRAMIDASAIARMKYGSVLVNTSRGGLIDESALLDALDTGRISAAALDVFAEEPVDPDNPLLRHPSTVTLPHVAARTLDNFDRMVSHWAGNIRAFDAGQRIDTSCLVE